MNVSKLANIRINELLEEREDHTENGLMKSAMNHIPLITSCLISRVVVA